jgi:hypothetical protein
VGTVPKFNRKKGRNGQNRYPRKHVHVCSLYCLGTETSVKNIADEAIILIVKNGRLFVIVVLKELTVFFGVFFGNSRFKRTDFFLYNSRFKRMEGYLVTVILKDRTIFF